MVHIDMAPNFAGTLMGITNFFANIISIISPLIAGLILEDEVRFQFSGIPIYCVKNYNKIAL